MKMTKLKSIVASISVLSLLTACGTATGPKPTMEFGQELDDGMYYVVNTNGIESDAFTGNVGVDENGEKTASLTTFEGVNVAPVYLGDQTSNGEILWFREDYDNIPTLYEGDFLVMYTNDVLTEVVDFKRFEDTGYSIGLCNLSQTKSGRCMINLSEDNFNITYPGADTDEILYLTNESVILESLGGSPLRFEEEETVIRAEEEEEYDPDAEKSLITPYGTLYLDEISPCMEMEALIYEGTVKHEFTFSSDVRIFGLMDEYECNDFEFISETIMKIQMPEWFNSGYYMINDVGLFRYVKETNNYTEKYGSPGTRPADIDFNVPNVNPEMVEEMAEANPDEPVPDQNNPVASSDAYFYDNEVDDEYAPITDDVRTDVLSTSSAGTVTITAVVEIPESSSGRQPDVVITLTTPRGRVYPFGDTGEDGVYQITFTSFNAGEEYYVRTYNLNGRDVKFSATEG